MVFKLMMSDKKKWRELNGTYRLPKTTQGVEFKDGIKQLQNAALRCATEVEYIGLTSDLCRFTASPPSI